MIRTLFIDLETTGLPKQPCWDQYYDPRQTEHYDSSRIVQICAITYDIDQKDPSKSVKKSEHDYIIKPDGFVIQNVEIHGIDHNMASFSGITLASAMRNMKDDITDCKLLVAHNLGFDKNVLLSELYRMNLSEYVPCITSMSEFCTSKGCTNLTRIPFNKTKFKQPKLSELYEFLFKKKATGLHNALFDTRIMIECFFDLMKIGYISLTQRSSPHL